MSDLSNRRKPEWTTKTPAAAPATRPPITTAGRTSAVKQRSVPSLPPVVSARGRKTPSSGALGSRRIPQAFVTPTALSSSTTSTATPHSSSSCSLSPLLSVSPLQQQQKQQNLPVPARPTETSIKKKSKKKKLMDWPVSSADYLPPLADPLVARLQDKDEKLEFPINEECKYFGSEC